MNRTALLATVLLACTQSSPEGLNPPSARRSLSPAPQSIQDLMKKAMAIDSAAVMVSEESFQALLSASGGEYGTVVERRKSAAAISANAADELALGVFGAASGPSTVDTDLFIVARNAALSPNGDIEATDFFVAPVRLGGSVAWKATSLNIAILNDFPKSECMSANRGCSAVFATRTQDLHSQHYASPDGTLAGLPADVIANFEASPGPTNAAGFRPSLRLFTPLTIAPNEFECRLPIEWSACEDIPVEGSSLDTGDTVPIPSGAVMLSERDFLTALRDEQSASSSDDDKKLAVEQATTANSAQAIGVIAELVEEASFDAKLFVVVRNPVLADERVQASQYYLASVQLSGNARWLGQSPQMVLQPPFSLNGQQGPCGPISVTEDAPRCDTPNCLPTQIQIQDNQPLFGNNRWPSYPRVTLRIPDTRVPFKDMTTFGCARWQPVPPTNPCGGVGAPGQSFIESCNGIDDDCDGRIDEGDVCADRTVCGSCQPRTCAQQGLTCGSTNNGCGLILTCGGACQ